MESVWIVDICGIGAILQHENSTSRHILCGSCNSMKGKWCLVEIFMILDVFQQIKSELVQSQVYDGNARGNIFNQTLINLTIGSSIKDAAPIESV